MLLIYDGQCDFCVAWLRWLQIKLPITALSFHDAPLFQYGLTIEECSKSVILLTPERKYSGMAAIAVLLQARGNRISALFIRSLGPVGRSGYRWVASHRRSALIRFWTRLLERRLSHES